MPHRTHHNRRRPNMETPYEKGRLGRGQKLGDLGARRTRDLISSLTKNILSYLRILFPHSYSFHLSCISSLYMDGSGDTGVCRAVGVVRNSFWVFLLSSRWRISEYIGFDGLHFAAVLWTHVNPRAVL